MIHQGKISASTHFRKFWQAKLLVAITGISLLLFASPAMAHHAMGGKMPSNFFEGFLSGLAHPLIGLDHFAFIVSIGLLAAIKRQGIWIPVAFIVSAMLGTGLHLMGLNLPGVELFVSGSILLFGTLLVLKDSPNTTTIIALAAIAGVFHGYAYGESIFGAQMSPLLAYLLGFTSIQLVVATGTFKISQSFIQRNSQQQLPYNLRSAGLVICGIGLAFLSSQVVNTLFALQG
ncbi:MAG TPA: HupE/UreJ family protein [Coleofasciculaceae cyanobacterium]|jgi:urease accessory protein